MSDAVDLNEFLAGFLGEAEEHLTSSGANILEVERALGIGETRPRAVRELYRSLHTIKGLSAMVGVEPIVAISHAMESVLRSADVAGGRLSQGAVELIQEGIRAIDERVRALSKGAPAKSPPLDLIQRLAVVDAYDEASESSSTAIVELEDALRSKFTAGELHQLTALAPEQRALRVDFTPSPQRTDGLSITLVRERVSKIADIVKVLPISMPEREAAPAGLTFALFVVTTATAEALAEAAGATAESVTALSRATSQPPELEKPGEPSDADDSRRGTFVRVEVSRLDEALEGLSSLVVTRFKLARAVAELSAKGVDTRELSNIVAENGRGLRDLRAAIVRTRMVSVRSLLERVPLMVRGLTRGGAKPIRVSLETGEAELDKTVGERILPAIVHLVRNAVDHGIETSEERKRAGKSESGSLRITCSQRSNNQLELKLIDDGRGIDCADAAERANSAVPKTDTELLELITRAGVSTAKRVTTTSGRGLGMDIVKRIVTRDLGGELSVESEPGIGTTFTLVVPLTITIVEAFSFECGGERFVTPIGSVEEIVEIDPANVVRVPMERGDGRDLQLLRRRGEGLPLFGLSALFGLKATATPGLRSALVVRRNQQPFAFEVERMLGHQEVVVRPLEDPLVRVTGVTGSTDLGDGKPTLVLDLVALSATVSRSQERHA